MGDNPIILRIFIQKYIGLVYKIASIFPTNGVVGFEDYISTGVITLIRIFEKYEGYVKQNLISYICSSVYRDIYKEAKRFIGSFTLSDYDIRILSKEKGTERALYQNKLLQINKIIENIPINKKGTCSIGCAIEILNELEKSVIQKKINGMSYRQISQDLNISRETVRNITNKIYNKICKNFKFEDFFE